MKRIILLLLIISMVFAYTDLKVESMSFDKGVAGINILELVIKNIGNETAKPVNISVSWECGNKMYETREIGPNRTQIINDIIYFPEADNYTFHISIDPYRTLVNEITSNNIKDINVLISLPKYTTVQESINLDNEKTPISCSDTDLMKIGRVKINGTYARDSNGNLVRDIDDPLNTTWLPKQEGSGCGTTSLAYVLTYLTGKNYTQSDVDPNVRMSWGSGTFSDPASLKEYAESQGVHAEMYIDGTMEEIEWFIDHNIPVMLLITVDGSNDVTKAHWVVAVSHCLRLKEDGNGFEPVIGIYNPWGYQIEIPYDRFLRYWGRMELMGIPLWNRLYIAYYVGDRPEGMPKGNIDFFSMTNLNTITSNAVGQFLSAFQQMGDGFIDIFSENFWSGVKNFFIGLGKMAIYGIETLIMGIIDIVVHILSFIWDVIVAIACFIGRIFGANCDGTLHYYLKTYMSSDMCGETVVYENGKVLLEGIGYISKEPIQNGIPIYVYITTDKWGRVERYIITNDSSYDENHPNTIMYEFVGYAYSNGKANTIKLSDALGNRVYTEGDLGYISIISKKGSLSPIWLINDTKAVGEYRYFITKDRCAGTRTFPVIISVKDDKNIDVGLFTRDQLIGYVYMNEDDETIPLFRFYDKKKGAFLISTNLTAALESGLSYRGIVGYAHEKVPGFSMTHRYMECRSGETELYQYYDQDKKVYILSTKSLGGYTNKTFLGCIRTCPSRCTSPLWMMTWQKVVKK